MTAVILIVLSYLFAGWIVSFVDALSREDTQSDDETLALMLLWPLIVIYWVFTFSNPRRVAERTKVRLSKRRKH